MGRYIKLPPNRAFCEQNVKGGTLQGWLPPNLSGCFYIWRISQHLYDAMSEFNTFLQLGLNHILDFEAYDHLLFIITLCAVYKLDEWRKILILVTAFTIGHSLTLVLSGLNILRIPSELVEFLIPVTIVVTGLHNVVARKKEEGLFSKTVRINYLLALSFGLIHGMGFANYFRSLMGGMESVVKPLFAFNVGIELGQLVIVAFFYSFLFLLSRLFTIEHREWNLFVSGAGAGGAILLIVQNVFA